MRSQIRFKALDIFSVEDDSIRLEIEGKLLTSFLADD